MRHDGTSAAGACQAGGGSWDQATLEMAVLTPLHDYWGCGGHREQTPLPGRMGWEREAECQDPSQAVWSSGQDLLCQQGNVELGRGIGLKVSCEDWTNMSRESTGCEEKSHNPAAIRVCRVHSRQDKVQISDSTPHPKVGCGRCTLRPFVEDSSLRLEGATDSRL